MIELELTAEAEEYGREVKREHDEAGTPDIFRMPGRDKRWTGFAVEHVLDAYFTERGINHVWNGGMDKKPDFEFGSLGVASKANSGPGPNPNFTFIIPKTQGDKLANVALFSILSVGERKVWVAGTIHSTNFRRAATLMRAGQEGFVPGRPLVSDCWLLPAFALGEPELFFNMLEVASAA